MLHHEVRGWFRKQDVSFYQSDFVSWKERWTKYVQKEDLVEKVKEIISLDIRLGVRYIINYLIFLNFESITISEQKVKISGCFGLVLSRKTILFPGSPVKKIPRMSKSKIEIMLITFFYFKGLIHHEFVPEIEVLDRLFTKIRKRKEDNPGPQKKNLFLLHDNAKPNTAILIHPFLTKKGSCLTPLILCILCLSTFFYFED
ncbi:hypothetical protein LAZ67_3006191 [Cordylochernes scorpioides]|uniref:Transposase n=1 Tax=Cordylochernes scorpioides TaxID=51811 RepID=A0ABY6KAY3_9ARAC|nr:hypothetical protein LAZ67_3006191 [Cordylochernes scorpioides]